METRISGRQANTDPVSDLPMRDGNTTSQIVPAGGQGFRSSYEGWKQHLTPEEQVRKLVSDLPMRDGNRETSPKKTGEYAVSDLPMRDGNPICLFELPVQWFVSDLPMRDGNHEIGCQDSRELRFQIFL